MWLSQVHKKQLVHWTSCKCTMLHQLIFANKIYLLCCPLILEHNKAMHITALTERRCTLHVWRRYRAHLLSSMESFSQGRFVYSVPHPVSPPTACPPCAYQPQRKHPVSPPTACPSCALPTTTQTFDQDWFHTAVDSWATAGIVSHSH